MLSHGKGNLTDLRIKRQDGRLAYVDVHGRRLEGSDPQHPVIVWTSVDVTGRHALYQELNRQAFYDTLTGLPNRRGLEQHIAQAIARANRQSTRIAVGMIDLDDFKPINDRLGHAAGDELLRQFSARIRERLRETDFIARVGGDEFVTVMEDLDTEADTQALADTWKRLHEAVDTPFELGPDRQGQVDMSMGVALYPDNGEDADALLRQADAAMYRIKALKFQRNQWWQLKTASTPRVEEENDFDAFGPRAQNLLKQASAQLERVGRAFTDDFHAELARDPAAQPILATLSSKRMEALKRKQQRHLQFVMSPETTREALVARSRQLGQLHALVGVTPVLLIHAITRYGHSLRQALEGTLTRAQGRFQLMQTADARLWLDVETQINSMQAVMDAYGAHTTRLLPPPGSWVSLAEQEMNALAALPGVRACQVLRPQSDGRFTVECSAGDIDDPVSAIMSAPRTTPTLDKRSASGQTQRSDAFDRDERTRLWHDAYAPLDVRSMVAIPVQNDQGKGLVLTLQGAHPCQFSSTWARTFVANLEQRWFQMVQAGAQHVMPVPHGLAERYREWLHADRLRMIMQPVIDLRSRRTVKVEALARLVSPDDELISPDTFLPALHTADLDILFRAGLHQALFQLKGWLARGHDIGVAVNVAPSTLVDPNCASWVEQALHDHEIAAHRLTLEMLETQIYDKNLHDASIEALHRLGVRLAIDDLGTGYSSLQRLMSLPFDVIKVDQGLVRDAHSDPITTLSLLRTIIVIGMDFDRMVVVEGLENEAILEAARMLGATYGQGYGIAWPMAAERVSDWIADAAPQTARNGSVHSLLGALAYHWSLRHQPLTVHHDAYSDCPLTTILQQPALRHTEAAQWHHKAHTAVDEDERIKAQERLIDWLAKQVCESAHAHNPAR